MVARGSWQQGIYSSLKAGYELTSPVYQLRGNARNYQGRYAESFRNLLQRIEANGECVIRTPGIRGGEYSATYRLA